ncbi:uncharacterized protein [Typha latifolia]|uniref:uncharacterized protein n=1 Tax=Typha latifolia TaxID=4733 RepID=UPI003C2E8445
MKYQHDSMVPTRNLLNHHYGSYSTFLNSTQLESLMADGKAEEEGEEEEEEEGEEEGEELPTSRSAKEEQQHDTHEGWLQLGIGGASSGDRRPELDLFSATKQSFPRPPVPTARVPVVGPLLPARGLWNLNCRTSLASSSSRPPLMRVVSPPRRPEAGVWLVLQAAHNQGKEPFLPQIPKSYLRIKDGTMTVRVLMKYLAKKLGMGNESEV